jgi:hypothetical protein
MDPYKYSGKTSGKYKLYCVRANNVKSQYFYDDLSLAIAFGERVLRTNGKILSVNIQESQTGKIVWTKHWETLS